jgi:hypothetical protein
MDIKLNHLLFPGKVPQAFRPQYLKSDLILMHQRRLVEQANLKILKVRNNQNPSGTRFYLWRADCYPVIPIRGEVSILPIVKNGHPIAGAKGDRYVLDDIEKTPHEVNYSLVVINLGWSPPLTLPLMVTVQPKHRSCHQSVWK